ncbi:MAG: helix-turn-helix domain-containing protein [Ekhidna sp.]
MIDTSLDSFNFYFFLAVIQGFILAGVILLKRPRNKPNTYLGILIFLFSLSLLHLILESSISGFNAKFPIPMDFSLAYGPLAYLHVLSLKEVKSKTTFRTYLHFLPSLLLDGFLFTGTFLFIRSNEDWAYANLEAIQSFALIMIALGLLQLGIYTYLIYRASKSIRLLPKEFPAIRKWFKIITITWLVVIGFLAVAVPVALLNIEQLDDNSYLIYRPLGIIMGLYIYGLGYLYLLKYINPINKYIGKSAKIKFTDQQVEEHKLALLAAIENDELFRDQKLSVNKLAEHLQWPINDVSLIINESLATNFNDLINEYRVRAFKDLAGQSEVEKYSILGIAQEVGFGSKASFYRAFKKEMGITPSEFLKSST